MVENDAQAPQAEALPMSDPVLVKITADITAGSIVAAFLLVLFLIHRRFIKRRPRP